MVLSEQITLGQFKKNKCCNSAAAEVSEIIQKWSTTNGRHDSSQKTEVCHQQNQSFFVLAPNVVSSYRFLDACTRQNILQLSAHVTESHFLSVWHFWLGNLCRHHRKHENVDKKHKLLCTICDRTGSTHHSGSQGWCSLAVDYLCLFKTICLAFYKADTEKWSIAISLYIY